MSFVELSRTLLAGEKIRIGGLELNKLKKLNGERFTFPFLSMVEASAIGLGATAVCKIICTCIGDNSDGLIVFISINFYFNTLVILEFSFFENI